MKALDNFIEYGDKNPWKALFALVLSALVTLFALSYVMHLEEEYRNQQKTLQGNNVTLEKQELVKRLS